MCHSFLRGSAKLVLYAVNTVFMLLGIAILTAAAYSYGSSRVFISDKACAIMAIAGGVVFFVALFGCCGAANNKKRYVMPYCLVLICTVVGFIVGGSILFHFRNDVESAANKNWMNLDDSEQKAANAVHTAFIKVYDDCAPKGTILGTKLSLKCTQNNDADKWFANWLTEKCRPSSLKEVIGCATHFKTTPNKLSADTAFCFCSNEIAVKVGDSSKVVGGMSWGLAGFQGLLMLLSVYLMCTRHHRAPEQEQYASMESGALGQPVVSTQPQTTNNIKYAPPATY